MNNDEQTLLELNRQITQYENDGDSEKLGKVIADELDFKRASGTFDDRESFLKSAKKAEEPNKRAIDNLKVSLNNTKAFVTCTITQNGKYYHNIRLFIKQDHSWKLRFWANEEVDGPKTIHLKDEDYVSVWQFFEGRAENIKQRIWTVFSFHSAILIALLGFFSKEYFSPTLDSRILKLAGIAGIFYSLFLIFQMVDLNNHLKRNWDRGTKMKNQVYELKDLLTSNRNRPLITNLQFTLVIGFCILILLSFFIASYLAFK